MSTAIPKHSSGLARFHINALLLTHPLNRIVRSNVTQINCDVGFLSNPAPDRDAGGRIDTVDTKESATGASVISIGMRGCTPGDDGATIDGLEWIDDRSKIAVDARRRSTGDVAPPIDANVVTTGAQAWIGGVRTLSTNAASCAVGAVF